MSNDLRKQWSTTNIFENEDPLLVGKLIVGVLLYSMDSGIMNEIHIPCAKLSAMDKKKFLRQNRKR